MRSHDRSRLEVIAAEADFAMQPAKTATERKASNACHRDDRPRAGEPERLSHLVEMRLGQPCLCNGVTLFRVYLDRA